jgi:hypothetical protein
MKKIVFIFTFFLILNNCGGFEFVYNTSDNVFLIKNVTNINVNGDDAYQIQTSLKDLIGHEVNNPKYKLLVNSVKTEAADVITKDATASKFVIKYTINYELYNTFKNCKVFFKEITTSSTYNAKSAGYSYGTDLSQVESSIQNINKNINEFISFSNVFVELNNCSG